MLDPPYVTREVWVLYAQAIKVLLQPQGRLLLSTLDDNAGFILELTHSHMNAFRPYIPSLIYQFAFYTNYESKSFSEIN